MTVFSVKAKVRTVDRGAKAFLQRVKVNRFLKLKVGIFPPDSDASYPDSDATIGEVAFYNEFGTIDIPARSWLRGWVDGNRTVLHRQQLELYQKALLSNFRSTSSSITAERAGLERLGKEYANQIQARISSSIPPPNAPETVARKGSRGTLIDTGALIRSVSHEVSK